MSFFRDLNLSAATAGFVAVLVAFTSSVAIVFQAALVAVDPPGAAAAVAVAKGDGALERVMRLVGGWRHAEQRAEFDHDSRAFCGSGTAAMALA